jgi:4-hydroxythreonine-4-phosphate dehydrogenase
MSKKIAITMGDPSGIGPEIIIKALTKLNPDPDKIILIGNDEIFEETEKLLKIKINPKIEKINISCDKSKILIGQNCTESGKLAFNCLSKACEMANSKLISAIVTAPLSKTALNMAGYHFSGQTEILNKLTAPDKEAQMLFVARDLKVLLLTRHIALKDISAQITKEKIINTTIILENALKNLFKIPSSKIAFCALNPHAGEEGLMGTEESDIIIPALEQLNKEFNINANGPFPADSIWVKTAEEYNFNKKLSYDAYVCLYHDQGLIPLKMLARDKAVNMTINLSVVRTSPAHGTAFDIAGKNQANPESMIEALKSAFRTF